jgi:ATP-dependent DNA helicase DinG
VATQYLGSRISRQGFLYVLRRLVSPRTGDGLLRFLAVKIHDGSYNLGPQDGPKWMLALGREFMHLHQELVHAIDEAADRTAIALMELDGSPVDRETELRLRLTPQVLASPLWQKEVRPLLCSILSAGRAYIEQLHKMKRRLTDAVEKMTVEAMSPLLELGSRTQKIEHQLAGLVRFLEDAEDRCRWIEFRNRGAGRKPIVAFNAAPLQIDGDLRERVYKRYKTVVMTSATLAVERKFDFFLGRVGAADPAKLEWVGQDGSASARSGSARSPRPLRALLLDTPFDYENQVYVGVPSNLPSPKDSRFPEALCEFLRAGLRISRGRAFVLFTSHALLNRVYGDLREELESEGYPCLRQGAAGRTLLTESFRRNLGSILFATASFWEGVDIPGEALSCLALTRLPFMAPGDPITDARIEALGARGLDPFYELVVPQAIIRFRQGFGRLIRRREDRGAVLICDARVATARYGRVFLRSLPTSNIHIAPDREVLEQLERSFADWANL